MGIMSDRLSSDIVDVSRWADTLEALESVQEGKLIDAETVTDWLKSWGSDNELPLQKMNRNLHKTSPAWQWSVNLTSGDRLLCQIDKKHILPVASP